MIALYIEMIDDFFDTWDKISQDSISRMEAAGGVSYEMQSFVYTILVPLYLLKAKYDVDRLGSRDVLFSSIKSIHLISVSVALSRNTSPNIAQAARMRKSEMLFRRRFLLI